MEESSSEVPLAISIKQEVNPLELSKVLLLPTLLASTFFATNYHIMSHDKHCLLNFDVSLLIARQIYVNWI